MQPRRLSIRTRPIGDTMASWYAEQGVRSVARASRSFLAVRGNGKTWLLDALQPRPGRLLEYIADRQARARGTTPHWPAGAAPKERLTAIFSSKDFLKASRNALISIVNSR
jgi:hypothetical protein